LIADKILNPSIARITLLWKIKAGVV